MLPDAKIQDSIRAIAKSENCVRLESLDDKILAEKQLDAMVKMADKGNMIIVPVDCKGTVINNQKP